MKKCLAVIVTLLMSLSLAACGQKIDPPDKVVENALTALKVSDFETAKTYFDVDPEESISEAETEQEDEIMVNIMQNLQYTIISTEENDDTATVKASIKNTNMSSVMSDYISEAFTYAFSNLSDEEMDQKFTEILNTSLENNKDNLLEKEVDITLTKGETGWIITMNDDLIDAITGGMLTIANNFSNAAESFNSAESNS